MKEGTIYEIVGGTLCIENLIFEKGVQFKVISKKKGFVDIMDMKTQKVYKDVYEMVLNMASQEVSSWA